MKSTCYVKSLSLGRGVGVCDAMYFNLSGYVSNYQLHLIFNPPKEAFL